MKADCRCTILMYTALPMSVKWMKSVMKNTFFADGVCLIEWGTLIEELLPDSTITITIEKDLQKGFDYRKITISNGEKQ